MADWTPASEDVPELEDCDPEVYHLEQDLEEEQQQDQDHSDTLDVAVSHGKSFLSYPDQSAGTTIHPTSYKQSYRLARIGNCLFSRGEISQVERNFQN